MVQAGLYSSGRPAEVAQLDVRERCRPDPLQRYDVGRPLARVGAFQRPRLTLCAKRMRGVERDPARPAPHHPGPGEVGDARVAAACERQQLEPGVPGQEGMRLAVGPVHDRVSRAHGAGAAALPAQPPAAENVEDLLLVSVDVHGHLPRARRHLIQAEADPPRPRGRAQPATGKSDVALGHLPRVDFAAVDHRRRHRARRLLPRARVRPRKRVLHLDKPSSTPLSECVWHKRLPTGTPRG